MNSLVVDDEIRKQKPSLTKYRIIKYTLGRLEEVDFRFITINNLCEDLEISRTTFYDNFRSKRDLFVQVIKHFQTEAFSEIRSLSYEAAILRMVDYIDENRKIFKNLILKRVNAADTAVLSQLFVDVLNREFQRQSDEGIEHSFIPDLASLFISGGLIYVLSYWISKGHHLTKDDIKFNLMQSVCGKTSPYLVSVNSEVTK